MDSKHFIAFDLGATSGRTILGSLKNGKLTMKELTRFPNNMVSYRGHYYWNIFSLYDHIKQGLIAAAAEKVEITSIGIDTWGVDFAMIAEDGSILGIPFAYRDPHTSTAAQQCFEEVISREQVYEITGIQIMNFNSLYQLYAIKRDKNPLLKAAKKILFMPDALSYMLTGNMVTEYTIASTSQILNPRTKEMDQRLLDAVGLDCSVFSEIVFPGHIIGTLNKEIAEETGLPEIPVVAVAGHDTASAVAAVPASDEKFAYLSSGTWSLMGIEIQEPIINQTTSELNITNEGGIEGTTRLLKNITGMWLVEQCLREWKKQGTDISYPQMVTMASEAEPFKAFVDPDHPSFANPQSMTAAISSYCEATGQPSPSSKGEFIRMIFESLALKYRWALDIFSSLSPHPIENLHIIGGGSRNDMLNQFTADSTGITVIAGPSEATAIGNIMIQAKAAGINDSLSDMRKMIAAAVDTKIFTPQNTPAWEEAYKKYQQITK